MYSINHTFKHRFNTMIPIILTICFLFVVLFPIVGHAQTVSGITDMLKSESTIFADSDDIRYKYDGDTGILTIYAVKTNENGLQYAADTAYIRVEPDGRWEMIPQDENDISPLTIDDARVMINKRLWLYKADKYDNSYMLDLTSTPIKDADGTEWYPLLDDFSTQSKFTAYLKEIFVDNIALDYISQTTVRVFGNELYDIGNKSSSESFNYDDCFIEQTFVSEDGRWHFYKVTVNVNSEFASTFTVGIYFSQNGWRIGYDGFNNVSMLDNMNKIENGNVKIDSTVVEDNPSTTDFSLIPLLFAAMSGTGMIFALKTKRR